MTATNLWFGGQSESGLTVTAEQTGGWFGGFVGDGEGFVGEGEGDVPVLGVPVAAAAPTWVKTAATRAVPAMMRAGRRHRGWRDSSMWAG
ncbi:hypothetical protein Pa4123_46550 [Phytohabitans aurantiacus]|uniref:Uncharacterized protein n=1 Tax=Phytohabitans aurantiacus TaxID=3016789 RepID=A0ABQ5QYZ4_9ACTN|nr:hypothetical protein Pa4123_46550 [Phytohabitans aurantiacus]